MTAEHERLREDAQRTRSWKRWGPYLAERQWGTVREDGREIDGKGLVYDGKWVLARVIFVGIVSVPC